MSFMATNACENDASKRIWDDGSAGREDCVVSN